jgi:preprotein translocase SecE subunit
MSETKKAPTASLPQPDTKGGIGPFFRSLQQEVKKIIWPTRKETTRLANTVVGVCVLLVGILTVLSLIIEFVFRGILRIS